MRKSAVYVWERMYMIVAVVSNHPTHHLFPFIPLPVQSASAANSSIISGVAESPPSRTVGESAAVRADCSGTAAELCCCCRSAVLFLFAAGCCLFVDLFVCFPRTDFVRATPFPVHSSLHTAAATGPHFSRNK